MVESLLQIITQMKPVEPSSCQFLRGLGSVTLGLMLILSGCNPLAQRDIAYTPSIWPVEMDKGYVSSEFGNRKHPISGKRKLHAGIDLAVDAGTPVFATANGVVRFAGDGKGYGNLVTVDHGGQLVSRYAHNKRVLVFRGEKVRKGQVIALSGKTGYVTGEHLHYEVLYKDKPLNPRKFLPRQ